MSQELGLPNVTGECGLDLQTGCAISPGFPHGYGHHKECTIRGVPAVPLRALAFDLPASNGSARCEDHFLEVDGVKFCGTTGPEGMVASGGIIRWSAGTLGLDLVQTESRWEVCWGGASPPSPTGRSPSAPPFQPPPLQPPPGVPLLVSTTRDLRSAIAEALEEQASRSINLAPRTFRLRGRALHLDCMRIDTAKKVSLSISGESATLDGMGRSRIFEIRGSCSLSLTGLRIINGVGASSTTGLIEDSALGYSIIEGPQTGNSNWNAEGAEGYGGAMYVERYSGVIILTRVTISDSTTHFWGGGIFLGGRVDRHGNTPELVMLDSIITRCSAGDAGGAFYLKQVSTTIHRAEISHCNADNFGGGGVVDVNFRGGHVGNTYGGVVDLQNASYAHNTAPRGASFVAQGGAMTNAVRVRDTDFSDSQSQSNSSVWILSPTNWLCPLGRWMPATGEWDDFDSCSELCAAGTVGTLPTHRTSSCGGLCPSGHYCKEGTVEPTPCPPGTISPTNGQSACSSCPHPLSSGRGSTCCTTCASGFYLRPPSDLEAISAKDCQACPSHANCNAFNTTLESLGVPPGYWRASPLTAELYRCYDSDTCLGSQAGVAHARVLSNHRVVTGAYCAEGHAGPRCKLCVDDNEYFSDNKRRCVVCPTPWRRFAILGGVALGAAALLAALHRTFRLCERSHPWRTAWCSSNPSPHRSHSRHARCARPLLNRLSYIRHRVGLRPKAKVLVSFYQICATFNPVYGVRLNDAFSGWADFVEVFSVDVLSFTYPSACLGSMQTRLLFTALWPYAAVLVMSLAIIAHAFVTRALQKRDQPRADERRLLRRSNTGGSSSSTRGSVWPRNPLLLRWPCFSMALRKTARTILLRCLSALVLVFYIVLPSVSRFIFEARRCESFVYHDETEDRISYLLADLSTHCNSGSDWSNGTHDLDAYFWTFFVLWPIAVPIGFLALLLSSRTSLGTQRVTAAAKSASFLWREYKPSFIYWEAVDLWRKVTPRHQNSRRRTFTFPSFCFIRSF